jgi:hypothetical protein
MEDGTRTGNWSNGVLGGSANGAGLHLLIVYLPFSIHRINAFDLRFKKGVLL